MEQTLFVGKDDLQTTVRRATSRTENPAVGNISHVIASKQDLEKKKSTIMCCIIIANRSIHVALL